MPLFSYAGVSPTVHASAWIAPTATLVGDVRVEADASVWYGAVLRADFGPITVRAGATVQDGAVIGDRCLVAAGSTVPPNLVVEAGQLVMGTPASVRGPLTDAHTPPGPPAGGCQSRPSASEAAGSES